MTAIANMESRKTKRPKFSAMADRMEYIPKVSAERMFEKLKAFRKVVGERPYKSLPVNKEELTNRYLQIRHDPTAWGKIIKEI